MGEALTAASVAFVTLTYRDKPEGFVYSDVQLMLKAFRIALWRERRIRVRFFCSGERGEKKGRHHWHLLFFFDKPYQMRRMRKRQIWHFWPHGWTGIQNLRHDEPEELLRKVRYTAKYAVKALGSKQECLMRCSLKPAIGSAYLIAEAVRTAEAGLVLSGAFTVPGAYARSEPGAPDFGKLVRFRMTGAVARDAIDAWERIYFERNPNAPYPQTRFLRSYAENFVFVWDRAKKVDMRTAQSTITVREPSSSHGPCREGFYAIHVGRDVAMLHVDQWGNALLDVDGTLYVVDDGIRDVLEMEPEDASRIDQWLAFRRGPNWRRTDGGEKDARARREARQRIDEDARQEQRRRAGTLARAVAAE